jgi:hypothetical protein
VTKRDGKYSGSVGEHYVLYRLIRECKDVNAVIATPNTDTVDIHAADKAGKPFAVQVKPKTNSHKWFLTAKHEHIEDPGLFYAFVDLGWDFGIDFDVEKPKYNPPDIKKPPELFVVPSEVVARAVHVSHQAWLRNGNSRKDGDMRDIYYTYPPSFGEVEGFPARWMEEYRECWELLC